MKWIDYTCLTLGIVGAINWGLIGFFRFDLVAFLFGDMTWLSRIIYALVGLAGLYLLSLYGRISQSMGRDCLNQNQMPNPIQKRPAVAESRSFLYVLHYKEITTFVFAYSGSSSSSIETLRTKIR